MFVWNESWATGNEIIDAQHKELFKAINSLLEACSKGEGQNVISKTMQFLIDYTKKHFGDEEKLQQQYHYPDYANHKKMHEKFKESMVDLASQLKAQGATTLIMTKISSSTGGWLISHIEHEDKKVAAHIRKQSGN
jgi:hemerythrin-like metal-binding protein